MNKDGFLKHNHSENNFKAPPRTSHYINVGKHLHLSTHHCNCLNFHLDILKFELKYEWIPPQSLFLWKSCFTTTLSNIFQETSEFLMLRDPIIIYIYFKRCHPKVHLKKNPDAFLKKGKSVITLKLDLVHLLNIFRDLSLLKTSLVTMKDGKLTKMVCISADSLGDYNCFLILNQKKVELQFLCKELMTFERIGFFR